MSAALIDLQLHTTCSDGVWSPQRLYHEVRARRLELFSVTDHDGVDAYPVPDDLAARCVPGLEVDTEQGGHTAHLLAYGISDPSCPLLTKLVAQRNERRLRMQAMVDRLNALGVRLRMESVTAQVNGNGALGRPHLARALVEQGVVSSMQEAFDRYLADGEACYVQLARLKSEQVIDLVHESGGVAVVAHPKRLQSAHQLVELCELGADGIEVVHPSAAPADQGALYEFADGRELLTTGGSDFHSPDSATGAPFIGVSFPRDRLERFLERVAGLPSKPAR